MKPAQHNLQKQTCKTLAVIFFAFIFQNSNAQIITTIAGNGIEAVGLDGGPATSASLNGPYSTAVDAAGNVYIADAGHNRIRKVTIATGIITTVAGNGIPGYSGDNGPATSAELFNPSSIVFDGAGNMYIADEFNNRIRKVTKATGIITTIAGNGTAGFAGDNGLATAAALNGPLGLAVAVDAAGNVYIADGSNYRIRKVTAATGIITTIAGNGTIVYNGGGGPATATGLIPSGIAIDGAGNLFIAANLRILKVSTNGIITTVAGNGLPGYNGDGIAATSAEFSGPTGITLDAAGNLYVADEVGERIRKIGTNGIITTIAGNGTAGFSGDGGAATSAELNLPTGVTIDAQGNVYIADEGNYRVRKVTTGGTLPLTLLSFTAQLTHGNALLNWQTGTEVNTAYFNLQRSATGTGFTTVDKQTAASTSAVLKNYAYTDVLANLTPVPTLLYYRLQEVDKDGTVNYSRIVTLTPPGAELPSLQIYPNPVQDKMTVDLKGVSGTVAITIISTNGKILLRKQINAAAGTQKITIATSSLAAGMYMLHIMYNGQALVQKFIKQ